MRRGLLAGVAFVLAGLALEVGRRRDRQKWLRIRERLASLRRLLTVDFFSVQELRARVAAHASLDATPRLNVTYRVAAEERRIRTLFGCPPAGAEASLEGGYFCPAGEKYAAKG